MDLPRRLFADTVPAYGPQFGRVTKSAARVAGSHTTPPAVLTYPVRDLQGDVLDPGGINFWQFENVYESLSNFEHGLYVGTTAVEKKSMPRLNAEGKPDESLGLIGLPIGVTTFFKSLADAKNHTLRRFDGAGNVVGHYGAEECWKLSDHLRPLVPSVYAGVSLEFRPSGPEGTAFKSLGAHPMLRGRPAYHFFDTDMIGLASACDIPVNQFAGYCPADAETIGRAEKALKYCESAGSLAVIRKSLSSLTRILKATPSGLVSAPVRRDKTMSVKPAPKRLTKAMYDDQGPVDEPSVDEPSVDETGMVDEPAPMGDEMPATAAAALQGAQGASDLCAMVRDMAKKGEHVKGRKKLAAICDQLDKIAAEYQAISDMVLADVGDGEDVADVEAEMDAEPMPVETDDDGGLMAKSLTATTWRPMRAAFVTPAVFKKAAPWTAAQIKTAKTVGGKVNKSGQVTVDAEYLKNLETLAAVALERV